MKPMMIRFDKMEIIPNVIPATATYAEPDTSGLIGPTVVVTISMKREKNEYRDKNDYRELYFDAVKEIERVLRDILELN
jgi:hypothetical protein